jgi:hypothetical protein
MSGVRGVRQVSGKVPLSYPDRLDDVDPALAAGPRGQHVSHSPGPVEGKGWAHGWRVERSEWS